MGIWGGGGIPRVSECDIERDTEKESGRPGGGGVKEPITFLTKRPNGVPMFCVIDSNVIKRLMLWAANANPCTNQEGGGGGVLNPLWYFRCRIWWSERAGWSRTLENRKNEKKIPVETAGHWMKIRKPWGKSGNFAIAIFNCTVQWNWLDLPVQSVSFSSKSWIWWELASIKIVNCSLNDYIFAGFNINFWDRWSTWSKFYPSKFKFRWSSV